MFSSTGTRSDSGSGSPKLQIFRPTARCSSSQAVMEIDAERALLVRPSMTRMSFAATLGA